MAGEAYVGWCEHGDNHTIGAFVTLRRGCEHKAARVWWRAGRTVARCRRAGAGMCVWSSASALNFALSFGRLFPPLDTRPRVGYAPSMSILSFLRRWLHRNDPVEVERPRRAIDAFSLADVVTAYVTERLHRLTSREFFYGDGLHCVDISIELTGPTPENFDRMDRAIATAVDEMRVSLSSSAAMRRGTIRLADFSPTGPCIVRGGIFWVPA